MILPLRFPRLAWKRSIGPSSTPGPHRGNFLRAWSSVAIVNGLMCCHMTEGPSQLPRPTDLPSARRRVDARRSRRRRKVIKGGVLERERGEGVFVAGLEVRREAPAGPPRRNDMAKAIQKITLDRSEDIPFDKLVLSQKNVRNIKGVGTRFA